MILRIQTQTFDWIRVGLSVPIVTLSREPPDALENSRVKIDHFKDQMRFKLDTCEKDRYKPQNLSKI